MAGEPPLSGIRVVEWTAGLAGGYAGFLLAAFGADVVRAGPGEHVLQRGKRSVDPGCWTKCLTGADVALTDEAGPAVTSGDGLVACRLTTWGAAASPRRLPPEEPLVAALTGVQAMQWSWA